MKHILFESLIVATIFAAGAYAAQGDGMSLQPGVLPTSWATGGPNCATVPDWQIHEYNEDFYILRESGCTNYEKPFLYLIFGQDKAILEDTGAGAGVQTAPFVADLVAKWAKKKGRAAAFPLIVIHSHGHGDHIAGDRGFQVMANVQFVAATPEEIQKAAGIVKWPTDLGTIELGNRTLDVIPIPGHHTASIAIYDRITGNLLTGDSLYPGRLYAPEDAWQDYAASAQRLADFVLAHPVAHVLGTHIEQSRTAYADYPTGTTYQPNEHVLELTRAHVLELNQAFLSQHGKPAVVSLPDFTLMARPQRAPRADAKGAGTN